jgi:hypothetical protein
MHPAIITQYTYEDEEMEDHYINYQYTTPTIAEPIAEPLPSELVGVEEAAPAEFVRVNTHLRRLPNAKAKSVNKCRPRSRKKTKVQKTTLDKWLVKTIPPDARSKHHNECADRQLAFSFRMEEMRLLLRRL